MGIFPSTFLPCLALLFFWGGVPSYAQEVAEFLLPDSYNSTSLWGTYNPGVYFELRAKEQNSIRTGIAWERFSSLAYERNIRHNVLHDEKKVDKVLWLEHDGSSYGLQQIQDLSANALEVNTTFSKFLNSTQDADKNDDKILSFRVDMRSSNTRGRTVVAHPASNSRVHNSANKKVNSIPLHLTSSLYLYMTTEDVEGYFSFDSSKPPDGRRVSADNMVIYGGGSENGGEVATFFETSCESASGGGQNDASSTRGAALDSCSSLVVNFIGIRLASPEIDGWNIEKLIREHTVETKYPDFVQKHYRPASYVEHDYPGRLHVLPNTFEEKANVVILQLLLNLNEGEGRLPVDSALRADVHVFTDGTFKIKEAATRRGDPQNGSAKSIAADDAVSTNDGSVTAAYNSLKEIAKSASDHSDSTVIGSRTTAYFDAIIRWRSERFRERFMHVYGSMGSSDKDATESRRVAFSNLLGSRGFFAGSLKLALPQDPHSDRKAQLISFVPCRSFFPRPFLWDDGFHLQVVARWSPRLVMEEVLSWMQLMQMLEIEPLGDERSSDTAKDRIPSSGAIDSEIGWIPREPAIGVGAQSRVPEKFMRQHWQTANPPSMILPIIELIESAHLASMSADTLQDSQSFTFGDLVAECSTELPNGGGRSWGTRNLLAHPVCWREDQEGNERLCDLHEGNEMFDGRAIQYRTSVVVFLYEVFPFLVRWYNYFITTQKSDSYFSITGNFYRTSEAASDHQQTTNWTTSYYRWNDRSAAHTMSSGLDDFPRGLLKSNSEAHLDLHSWISFLANTIHGICRTLNGRHSQSFMDARFPYLKKPFTDGESGRSYNCKFWSGEMQRHTFALLGHPVFLTFQHGRFFLETGRYTTGATGNSHDNGEEGGIFYNKNRGILNDFIGNQPYTKTKHNGKLHKELLVRPPWREDGRCGLAFPDENGRPGRCSPYGGGPCCSASGWCGSGPEYCHCEGCIISHTIEARPSSWGLHKHLERAHSPHIGVVALMPLFFGLLPRRSRTGSIVVPGTAVTVDPLSRTDAETWVLQLDETAPNVGFIEWLKNLILRAGNGRASLSTPDVKLALLDKLLDKLQLQTSVDIPVDGELLGPSGVRSLSSLDTLYGAGENYWRGHVWINMNYLVVRALSKYYCADQDTDKDKRCGRLVRELQSRVTATIQKSFLKQGSLFERYDDVTGRGLGAVPFTGWTTTFLLMNNDT